ncbi:MAG: hypothetical protein NZ528_00870 [Caldilineales bacterium]|nr:hypothetical protein [Caldilineales bacterium]
MNDLFLSPVGPALLLLLTGVLLRLAPQVRRSSLMAAMLVAPSLAALALLLRLRLLQVPDLTTTWSPLVIPPLQLRWSLDGWNWLALLLLTIVGLGAVLLTWRLPGPRSGAFHGLSLLLLSAAALAVVSGNLLTLSGAWIASDVLLVARAREPRAPQGAVQGGLVAAGSLLFTLAIYITNASGVTAPLARATLPPETVMLLGLAAALRMAVYPLHQWLAPGPGAARTLGTGLLLCGVSLVTGGWLLGRLYEAAAGQLLTAPFWPLLLVALTLAAGLAAWATREADCLTLLTSSRGGWLWLTLAMAAPGLGRDALGWGLVTAVLGIALFAVGQVLFTQWGWRLPLLLSGGLLVGAPLLAGFPVRALAPAQGLPLWLLLTAADGLAVASVLAPLYRPRSVADPGPQQPAAGRPPLSPALSLVSPLVGQPGWMNWPLARLLVAFSLIAVPVFVWGLRPELLAQLAGFGVSLTLAEALRLTPPGQWLSMAAALALAVGLAWAAAQPALAAARSRLAVFLRLDWALDAALNVLAWLGNVVRMLLRTVEGEGYVGWVALLALLIWLLARG